MITTFDELVAPDSTTKIINYFVDHVNLKEMRFKNTTAPVVEGGSSFPPSNMIKMYLYGYRNGIRSSRKLAKVCEVNIEVIWLIDGVEPDFRVISDFRKDNIGCMKKFCHEFTRWVTVDMEKEDVFIDGSKFKVWNLKGRSFTIHKLEEMQEHLEKYRRYRRTMEKRGSPWMNS